MTPSQLRQVGLVYLEVLVPPSVPEGEESPHWTAWPTYGLVVGHDEILGVAESEVSPRVATVAVRSGREVLVMGAFSEVAVSWAEARRYRPHRRG